MSEKYQSQQEEPIRNKTFRQFKGVVTRANRNAIPEDSFYDLENLQVIGDANIHSTLDKSPALHDYSTDVIYWFQYANVGGTDYVILFSTNGKVFAYNIGGGTSAQINVGHLLSGSGSRMDQWKNQVVLFIDSTGYYSWDGTTFSPITGAGVPSSGTEIAVFAGRVWIFQSRVIVFSGADDYTAPSFLVANGAGAVNLTDPQLRSNVTRAISANGYLYFAGSSSINVISDVYVPSGANPPTPLFTNLNIQAIIGSDQPGSFFTLDRNLMFANKYGVYAIDGVTADRVSEDIDGTWQYVDFSQSVTGGCFISNNILTAGFCIKRANDPVFGSNTVIACISDDKWWFGNFGSVKMVTGAVSSGRPTVFGMIGNVMYELFSTSSTTDPTTKLMTPLWPMEDPLSDKVVIRAGFEVTVQSFSGSFSANIDTVNSSLPFTTASSLGAINWINNSNQIVLWQNNSLNIVQWFTGQFLLYSGASPGGYSKYVGMTITVQGKFEFGGAYMDYKLGARWT